MRTGPHGDDQLPLAAVELDIDGRRRPRALPTPTLPAMRSDRSGADEQVQQLT